MENKIINSLSGNTASITPTIGTKGNQIIRTDTGEPVVLKGVTSDAFRNGWQDQQYPYAESIINKFNVAKQMGANLITLYIDGPDYVNQNLNKLDQVVNWANKNGMYIALSPVVNGNQNDNLKPNDPRLPKLVDTLSKRYSNDSNVIYGTGEEPHDITWQAWNKKATELGNIIQKNSPNAPIMVGGTDWGGNLNEATSSPVPLPNVIYNAHSYATGSMKDTGGMLGDTPALTGKAPDMKQITNQNPRNYDQYMGKLPMIIGEFGAFWDNNFGSPQDLNYIQNELGKFNKNKTSYTMHTIDTFKDNGDQNTSGLSLTDNFGNLTPKGKLIAQDFKSNPPTSMVPKTVPEKIQSATAPVSQNFPFNFVNDVSSGRYKPLTFQLFDALKKGASNAVSDVSKNFSIPPPPSSLVNQSRNLSQQDLQQMTGK